MRAAYSPLIVDRLDDEAQCGADRIHILAHNLLDDGCLARIIETSVSIVSRLFHATAAERDLSSHSIKILNSLSLSLAFRRIDNIVAQLPEFKNR